MAKVSVIVPALNTQDYLGECLDSIFGQTLKDIEVICVNDGSTDRTLEIMEEYAARYDQVKIIDQVNRGLSCARNAGLEIAAGTYVYFMDSDDLLAAEALEELTRLCDERALDLIFFAGDSFFENEALEKKHGHYKTYYTRKGQYPEAGSGPELFALLWEQDDYFPHACLQMSRRDFLQSNQLRFEDGILHEDNLHTFQAIMTAGRAACVKDVFFHRRVRGDSIMTQKLTHRNLYGYYISMRKEMDFAARSGIQDPRIRDQVEKDLDRLCQQVRRVYRALDKKERSRFLDLLEDQENYLFRVIIKKEIEARAAADRAKKSFGYRAEQAIKRPLRAIRRKVKGGK